MKIDVFNHIITPRYHQRRMKVAPAGMRLQDAERSSSHPVRSGSPAPRHGHGGRRLRADHQHGQSARREHGRSRRRAGIVTDRERRDGGARLALSRPVPWRGRLSSDEQPSGDARRARPRGRGNWASVPSRSTPMCRDGRSTTPRSLLSSTKWRTSTFPSCSIRFEAQTVPTIPRSVRAASIRGGSSAGPTIRRRRWPVWRFRASSIGTRPSRSSRIIWVASPLTCPSEFGKGTTSS